jgi:Tfp pilus assembly protein PilN
MLRINLLPQTLRPKMSINLDILFFIFLILGLAAVGFTFASVQSKTQKTSGELAALQLESAEQKKLIDALRAKENTRDMSATQALVAKRKKWNSFIKELTYIMPQDVWILKMQINARDDGVGVIFSGLAPSQKSVNRFLGRMERSPSFQTVKLNSSKASPGFTPALYAFDFSVNDIFANQTRGLASEGQK